MKKILFSIGILIVLVLGAAVFLPYLFKDQIIAFVKQEANEQLEAELSFDNSVKINFFRSFPDLSIGFRNLAIIHPEGSFKNDTFFYAKELSITLDLMKLYKEDIYQLKEIELSSPFINAEVDENMAVSWDITTPSSDTSTSSQIAVTLDDVKISNGRLRYDDLPAKTLFTFNSLNHRSKGEYTGNALTLESSTDLKDMLVVYDGITYVSNWEVKQEGPIAINLETENYSFDQNQLKINGLPVEANGYTRFIGDDIDFNLEAHSTTTNVNHFLSLIPAIYATDFEEIATKGKGNLSFTYKGLYNDVLFPAYDLKLSIENGWFKYPDLPIPGEDLNLDLHVFSLDGNTDKTIVDLSKFHFKLKDNPFDGSLKIADLFSDPLIDLVANGIINLDDFKSLMPLPEGTSASGEILTDIAINGKSSAIANSKINAFKAAGSIQTNNLVYKTAEMPETLTISAAKVELNDQQVNIPIFNGKLGRNEIETSGKLTNFFSYLMDDQTLDGDFTLKSKSLNLNDFTTESTEISENGATEMTLIEVPGDMDVTLKAEIAKLIYDDLELTNFKGTTQIQNRSLVLQNVSSEMLGGVVRLDGNYQYDVEKPNAKFDISYTNIAAGDLIRKFKVVRVFAPLIDQFEAITTAKLSFSSLLNQDMSPQLSNINLAGTLNLENVQVKKLKLFDKINEKLGVTNFTSERIQDFLMKFKINEGKLFVSPVNLLFDSSMLTINGISKIDGTIDYNGTLSVPSSLVANNTSVINGLTAGTAFDQFSIKPNSFLKLGVNILGTITNPQIQLNLKEIKENVKSNLKSALQSELDKQKKDAKQQAETEVNKIRTEAETKVNEATDKAKAELERKKKEAEEKLRKEAEEKKKQLKEEAEQGLKDIFKGLGGNKKGGSGGG